MATKLALKTTFEADKVIQPIFTGGSVALDNGAKLLATTLGEDAVLTNLTTGRHIAKIEGDGEPISTLTLTPSGSHLVICSRSLSMRIYALKATDTNTIEATLVRTLKPHATPVVVLAVDKTSTLLATGAADGAIKIWDISGGYVTHTVSGPSVLISALHFFEIASGSEASQKSKKTSRKSQQENGEAASSFRLAYGRQDGKVRVWDLHKRGNVSISDNADSPHHVTNVQGLDYSATQNTLVSTGRDRTIIWWNVGTWKRRMISVREPMEAIGFLEDGRLTYAAGANGYVRIWETDTGRELTAEQPAKAEGEAIVSAVYNRENSLVLCAQADHTIAVYQVPVVAASAPLPHDLPPLQPLKRISGTHDDILDLAYILPDRSLLALATNSEDVRLVSIIETPSDSKTTSGSESTYFGQDVALLKGHTEIVMCLDTDWSGHWVATGSRDNTARVWKIDPASGSYTCHAVFTGHVGPLGAVALPKTVPQESSDAAKDPLGHPPVYVLTGSGDLNIKKWPIPRQTQLDSDNKGPRAIFSRKAHDKDINAIDISPGGQLFASASQDKTVKIWDVEAGEVQGLLRGHKRGVWSVRFAPSQMPAIQGDKGAVSGKGVVLTGSGDKTIKLWNLTDYTCIRTFEGHSNNVLKVAWLSPPTDGNASKQRILFASAGGDGLVKVWDANLGESECTLDNHEDRVWALTTHPETNTIVSGGGDSIINFWKDTSEITQAAATEAALKLVEQEQELENYIYSGSYREAIILALQLNHPGRLLNLFTNVVTTSTPDEGSLCGLKAVDKVLANLSDEQIFLLLLRLRDWNTNAKTAPIAQRILWTLVRSYPASKFSSLSVKGARGQKSLKEVLNALKVYTERHYKRMEELVDESYLVEYTLQEMDSLAPALDSEQLALGSSSGEVVMADA
ncbi:WD40 repeat-like protein [Thozetella sp. PMI_491]|nr:WD40 repeat-like protein [Thozetella sp. PMI_491]